MTKMNEEEEKLLGAIGVDTKQVFRAGLPVN